jgi:L-asparagine transporter-like permease
MRGDGSGFIGLAIALLFLIMDVWVIIQYRKDRDAALERDIRARVWRDALAPVALSTFFLFLSILNLFAGDREGMIVFFVLFAALLLVGIIFYLQKRKIIG